MHELEQCYDVRLEANDTTKRLTGCFTADSLALTLQMIEEVLDVEIRTMPSREPKAEAL